MSKWMWRGAPVLVVLVAALAWGALAGAGGGNDPERSAPASQPAAAPPAAFPSSVDSDVYVYAISPNFRTYFAAAGHLVLSQVGTTNEYKGTFTDYVGGKASSVTVDTSNATNPTMVLKTQNGTFEVVLDTYFGTTFYSGTVVNDTKISPANTMYLSATQHAAPTSVTYDVILTQRVGPATPNYEVTGVMTILYDANNRIAGGTFTYTDPKGNTVNAPITGGGYYSSSYTYIGGVTVNKLTFGFAGTFSGTYVSGNAFAGTGAKQSLWVWSGTPA